jgi:hypothetical protein
MVVLENKLGRMEYLRGNCQPTAGAHSAPGESLDELEKAERPVLSRAFRFNKKDQYERYGL